MAVNASATITTPATPKEPNNPFYLQAKAHKDAGDIMSLMALDAQLAAAGYAETGQTRVFIAQAIQEG